MRPKAYLIVRENPPYRSQSFAQGLTRLGYDVLGHQPDKMDADDVAVIWNKTYRSRRVIDAARASGAALLVTENGYMGQDAAGIQNYALALDGHNGSGRWHVGDEKRLRRMNPTLRPWVSDTGRVLLLGQRGIGCPLMASPHDFERDVAPRMERDGWNVRLRPHPGAAKPKKSLDDDLDGCSMAMAWSSNAATRALELGVPVLYAAPYIVTAGASKPFDLTKCKNIARATCTDEERWAAFVRMAWAQWSLAEISSGEALVTLLDVHRGHLPSCQEGAGV